MIWIFNSLIHLYYFILLIIIHIFYFIHIFFFFTIYYFFVIIFIFCIIKNVNFIINYFISIIFVDWYIFNIFCLNVSIKNCIIIQSSFIFHFTRKVVYEKHFFEICFHFHSSDKEMFVSDDIRILMMGE